MRNLWALALLSLWTLSGCGPQPGEDGGSSSLKWGHLAYREGGTGWFVNVKPTDKIEVCTKKAAPPDANFQIADSSIRKWVKPLGRDKAIQIVKCGEASGTKFKVDITLNSNDPDCSGSVLGWTMVETGEMHICKSAMSSNSLKTNVTLHEFGHMFGMCDQYSGGVGCDSAHSAKVDNNTIMGNGIDDATDLVQDDIDGINNMASRSEFAATKKAWEDFLKNGGGTGGGTTPPTGGGTTPPTGGGTGGGTTPPTGGGTTPPTGGGTTPPGGGGTGGGSSDPSSDIFIGFAKMSLSNPVGFVWMATNDSVARVALCQGNKATCTAPGALVMNLQFSWVDFPFSQRKFFRSKTKTNVKQLNGVYTLLGMDQSGQVVVSRQVTLTPKASLMEP